jgi:hypothetical protein
MKTALILILFLITGCTKKKMKYIYNNDVCKKALGGLCGYDLYECESKKEYICVTNITIEKK